MTSRLDNSWLNWNLKVVTMDTPLKFFALSLIKRIQTTSSLEVGITISWSGILDNNHLSDPFMAHTFVEIPLICTMGTFWLVPTLIRDNCNFGTSVPVSQSKTFLGTRDFHLRRPVKFMELNSKRALVTWSSLEVVAPTKSKFSMATTCSSLAPKLRT